MFGFLNIYKPRGITSHDVVSKIRRITKIKQIGHTGTLDPFAEGVLPVCIGKATRLIEYLNDDKAYIGTVQFGQSTTTYDLEGEIVHTSHKCTDIKMIKNALKKFIGDITQIPPIYSAIKINGKKLYEYARKGEKIDITPRKATIQNIKILNFDFEKQQAEIYIECSKGTYIRSIANDLGEELGTYAHLVKLVRTKAGDFQIDNAVKLETIDNIEKITSNLISPLNILNYRTYDLNKNELIKVSNGNSININQDDGMILLLNNNEIKAVADLNSGIAKCKKVF